MGPFKPAGKKPPTPDVLPRVAMAMVCEGKQRSALGGRIRRACQLLRCEQQNVVRSTLTRAECCIAVPTQKM